MAGAASGAIMDEDYFGSAAEWGDEADGGQVRGTGWPGPRRGGPAVTVRCKYHAPRSPPAASPGRRGPPLAPCPPGSRTRRRGPAPAFTTSGRGDEGRRPVVALGDPLTSAWGRAQ